MKFSIYTKYMIVMLILLTVWGILFLITPKLVIDETTKVIEVNTDYTPVSFKAFQMKKDLSDYVTINGSADIGELGEYNILYELRKGIFTIRKILTVKVVDTTAPVLTLEGEEEYTTCSIDSYTEVGYKAMDNYDGDITDKVETNKSDDTIEYSVTDSSNNTTKSVRKLIVGDKIKPELSLIGDAKVELTVGEEYKELGVKAVDNCLGDISSNVVVEGSVDTKTPGTYTLTYTVKDAYDNTSTVTRTVIVKKKKTTTTNKTTTNNTTTNYNSANNSTGVIYLTFDDGPGAGTSKILDVLDKYNVKATFFVTNSGSDALLKREADAGHTVALHTASHQYSIYTSVDTYFADLNIVAERVKRVTGIDSKYIRFPGGSSNTVSKRYNIGIMSTLAREVENRGYRYFDWNVSVEDAGGCSAKSVSNKSACVFNNFKRYLGANKSNVVLLHDIKTYTAEALEDIVKYGLEHNYTFKAIDENTPNCHHGINN